MAGKRGCFKNGCFGCLGLLGLGLVILGIFAVVGWRGAGDAVVSDEVLNPLADREFSVAAASVADSLPSGLRPGQVILKMGQGEFYVESAAPGEGLRIEARYDTEVHQLAEEFEMLADSTWVYKLGFQQTMPGMQALFRKLFGGGGEASVKVFLPCEVPIDLVLDVEQGGVETDLGGLWLTGADLRFRQGGMVVSFSEPLREPLDRLSIYGRMGGVEADRLGNASPRELSVDCAMGGANVDLRGDWTRDCAVDLSIRMGGMAVQVPPGVTVRGVEGTDDGPAFDPADPEVPLPVLTFSLRQKMGEIEVDQ